MAALLRIASIRWIQIQSEGEEATDVFVGFQVKAYKWL